MRPLIKWLEGRSPVQMSVLGVSLVAALALAERHGPERLSYMSMFLLLTAAVGWFGGLAPAVITAAAAAAGYMSKEVWQSSLGPPFPGIDGVNFALRWGSCAGVGWLAAALRRSQEELVARVVRHPAELPPLVGQHENTVTGLLEGQERLVGRAEDSLEAQQTRQTLQLRTRVLESMSEAVVLTDQEHRIAFTNQAADRLFGYESGALLGQPAASVMALQEKHFAPLLQAVGADLDHSGTWSGDSYARQQDGGTCLCAVRITRLAFADRTFHVTVLRDVTEQRRTQATLRLQALVLQTMAEGVLLVGPDQTIRLTNPALEASFGYAPGALLGQPVSVLNVWSAEETTSFNRLIMQAVAERGVWTGEYANRRQDGSVFTSAARISTLTLDGETHSIGVQQDITARKQAEEALRISEEKFAKAFRASPDGFILTSVPDSQITEVNEATSRISGYPREELLGRTTAELGLWADPDARGRYIDQMRRAGQVAEFETVFRTKSGTLLTCLISGEIIHLQSGPHFLSVIRDITQQKLAEEQARRWQQAFETAAFAMAQTNVVDNTFLAVNPACAQERGYTPEELVGRPITQIYAPEELPVMAQRMQSIDQVGHLVFESVHRRKDGSTFPVLMDVTTIRDAQGRPVSRIAYALDITGRKQAEAALRESEEKYRVLFAASPDAYFILAEGRLVDCNHAAEIMLRGGQAQILGLTPAAISPPLQPSGRPSQEAAEEVVAQAIAVGRHQFEWVHRRLDGTDFWAEVAASTITMQGRPVLFAAWRDITDRKQAEASVHLANRNLEEARSFYLSILESIKSGVVVSGADDVISYANKAFATIAGTTTEAVVQRQAVDGLADATMGQLAMYYRAARSTRQPVAYEAVPVRTLGGRATYQSGWFLPRLDAAGYAGMIGTVEDVTERLEAERLTEAQRALVLALSSLEELEPAVEGLLHTATQLEQLNCGGVYLVNQADGDLELVAHTGLSPAFVQAIGRLRCGTAQAGIVQAGQPVYSQSAELGLDLEPGLVAEGLQFLAVIPLRQGVTVIGSLNLGSRTQGEISPATRAFVEGIAAQAGGAIARIRAQDAQRKSEIRLRAIIAHAPIALLAVNRRGCVTFSDGRALRAINELPNQHDGLPLAQTALCRRAPIVLEHSQRALAGEQFTTHLDLGSAAFEISYSPHFDRQGGADGFIAVATNVTDRLRLERELLETTEREQARIGQDIHDGLCQQIVGIAFDVNALADALVARAPVQATQARRIAEYVDAALTHARQLARGLFPVKLEADGLSSALQELAASITARHPLRCWFEQPAPVLIPDNTMATHIFRIAQEAVNNALKHARASQITIHLAPNRHQLELTVTDNGGGLSDQATSAPGLGRHIMEYRARSLGGTLHIRPGANGGTVVSCCLPLPLV